MTALKPSKTVLETIHDWSLNRPLWQRDALRRIIVNGTINKSEHPELIEMCKSKEPDKICVPLVKIHLPSNPDAQGVVRLLSLKNVQNVNNLAADQNLTFIPDGLNIVYGDNGSGKSGYVRILKKICRARHTSEIQKNIFSDASQFDAPTATIGHSINGGGELYNAWIDGQPLEATLSAISVFDSNCAAVHLTEKNEVAFRPFGLDIPDELATLCQAIKEALIVEQELLKKSQSSIFLRPVWKANTAVGLAIAKLNYNSLIDPFKTLAELSVAEKARLEVLKEDLTKDPVKASNEQRTKAEALKRLNRFLKSLADKLSNKNLNDVFELAQDVKGKRKAVAAAANLAFSNEKLDKVGGETWRLLWDAARKYSFTDAYPNKEFPNIATDAACVLCQQPLSSDAADRLKRFEGFVQSEVEQTLKTAKELFVHEFDKIKSLQIDLLSQKNDLKELVTSDAYLGTKVVRFISCARLRRYNLVKSFPLNAQFQMPGFEISAQADLSKLITEVEAYAHLLLTSISADDKQKLQQEYDELNDRLSLSQILPELSVEIDRQKSLKELSDKISETNTTSITILGNDIADTVITPKLRDRFQEEIIKLAAEKVRVEIIRAGGKYGSPHYQIRLLASPNTNIATILSEGEQTCVSLAAFLTELATATHNSALIFDDPVTSLDHRWRSQIAKRLAEEAGKRQIVVFTHDITFVHDLLDCMEKNGNDRAKCLFLNKGVSGVGVVNEGLPWIAKKVEDRIDKLEKECSAAKILHENDDEERYDKACVAIYNNLRSTWERALEDVAFQRVIQRHRDYINAKNLKKTTVVDLNDCELFAKGFRKCSDITEAHDPSRGRNSSMPSPAEIKVDIETVKNWVIDLRRRQNAIV